MIDLNDAKRACPCGRNLQFTFLSLVVFSHNQTTFTYLSPENTFSPRLCLLEPHFWKSLVLAVYLLVLLVFSSVHRHLSVKTSQSASKSQRDTEEYRHSGWQHPFLPSEDRDTPNHFTQAQCLSHSDNKEDCILNQSTCHTLFSMGN